MLIFITAAGEWITAEELKPLSIAAPDPGDLPFAQTALAANVDILVTGNSKHFHFLNDYGIQALSPTEFLTWFEHQGE